jgi:hypothetical protein
MIKIPQEALNELDIIVKEEYGRTYALSLFEADEEDDVLSTPISRAASFPARAIRYKKAKSVMNKYARKILSKIDKIIDRFEAEIDKSIPQITAKGKDLQNQLNAAKSSGDQVEAKSVVNQQKKFTEEVKQNQEQRVSNLNQTIENLINTYTTAIHKRIDEPGYVLKVEISDKGKADLKFSWDELVSSVKQKSYEKLVKIINNKNIKALESLVSRLEVEIEKADDERRKYRSSSRSIKSDEEDPKKSLEKKLKDPKSDFEKLLAYLNEKLNKIGGEGIGDKYTAARDENGTLKIYEVDFHVDLGEEKIEANYYEEDSDDISFSEEIDSAKEADSVLEDIESSIDIDANTKTDSQEEKLRRSLLAKLDTLFKSTAFVEKNLKGYDHILKNYKKSPDEFAGKVIEALIKEKDIYSKEIEQIKTTLPEKRLMELLKQISDSLDYDASSQNPQKKLKDIQKSFTDSEAFVVNAIKERGLADKDWKLIVNDIILSATQGFIPTVERLLKLNVHKSDKINALKNSKNIIKLLNFSASKTTDKDSIVVKIINKIKKSLGDDAIQTILDESFISLADYKKLNS